MSFTRDLTRSRSTTTPCLHGTTTGGATGAGNETTGTKTGIEKEKEVIRAARAVAPAALDGLAQTRDDQVCAINLRLFHGG